MDLIEFLAELFSGHLQEVLEGVAPKLVTMGACFNASLACASSYSTFCAPFEEFSSVGPTTVTVDVFWRNRVVRAGPFLCSLPSKIIILGLFGDVCLTLRAN